ncbi:MAG: beta-propeller domain-containing protein [Clostridia bacterium]
MKKYVIIIGLVLCGALLLTACMNMTFTGDPKERANPDTVLTNSVTDGDIVQLYGNYIISASPTSLNITHANNGYLTLTASNSKESVGVSDIIVWGDYLVSAYYYVAKTYTPPDGTSYTDYYTQVNIYDLTTLGKGTQFAFESLYTVQLDGKCEYVKTVNDTLYLFSNFKVGSCNKYEQHNFGFYEENGEKKGVANILVVDASIAIRSYSTLVAVNVQDEFVSTSAQWYGVTGEVCFYSDAIIPIIMDTNYSSSNYFVMKLSAFTLEKEGVINEKDYKLINRYALNYDGEYIMIASYSSSEGSRLNIYDSNFNLFGSVGGIAIGETLKSVRYSENYCYLVTYLQIDPVFKIDISDRSAPIVVDELKIDGYSIYLHILDDDLAFGVGVGADLYTSKITLFDTASEQINEIKSIEIPSTLLYASVDPRSIFIDRENQMIIFIGVTIEKEEKLINGETTSVFYATYNMFLLEYPSLDSEMTTVKISNKYEMASKEQRQENELLNPRCVVIDDYIYIVSQNKIKSYDFNRGYKEKSVLLLP